MPLETRLTEMIGIEHPLVMGGLTGVGTVELAAAVSNAGGLGMFTSHNAGSPEAARLEIRRLKTLTSKPFGVNLTVLPTIGPPPPYEEYCRMFIEEGVPVVETAGSNPSRWISMFKAASPPIVCIHKCVSIRHALKAEKLGVDIISLDGFECVRGPLARLLYGPAPPQSAHRVPTESCAKATQRRHRAPCALLPLNRAKHASTALSQSIITL